MTVTAANTVAANTAAISTVAINAAFLREIKEDHHDLWNLMDQTERNLLASQDAGRKGRRVALLLGQLRERLRVYFELEETFGYCDDAVCFSAGEDCRAEGLRAQHRTLLSALDRIVERASDLLSRPESPLGALRHLALSLAAFYDQFSEHEAQENLLIRLSMAAGPGA